MLQYLLNLTATWLLSLVIFDLFLKKETYHGYNRTYLLVTFVMGLLLPLWSWSNDAAIYNTTFTRPVQKLVTAKQDMASAAATSASFTWQQYLWYLYLAGVAVSLVLLVFEVSKIIVLYQVGNRSKEGKWTVVETVKGHAPFSIFHILFVDSKDQYTPEQWSIILDHEEQHSRLWHFADQLLMQVCRIIFWFHPLVYLYSSRLMLLHEYQADKVSGRQPAIYGKFLIEQALLHTAPKLTHSLNRSPIKTRITMLTKTSSFLSRTKGLLFIPLVLICMVCFAKNQYSNKIERNGNIVTYRGNKFEFSEAGPTDTVTVIDPVTGKEKIMIAQKIAIPLTMNGKKIYSHNDLEGRKNAMGQPSNNECGLNGSNLKEYLVNSMSSICKDLPDNDYTIRLENIVVDENGKIVFFEFGGLEIYKHNSDGSHAFEKLDKSLQDKITEKMYNLLNDAPAHNPGTIDGKDVPFLIVDMAPFWNPFTVKDHKVIKL